MKQSYLLLLLALFAVQTSQAQIVNIPDANFKSELINRGVDTNNDGEIQISEAESVNYLGIYGNNISDLTGIEFFSNLYEFGISDNPISSIDLSALNELYYVAFRNTQITSLNTNMLPPNIDLIDCSNNQITSIDLSNANTLAELFVSDNPLSSLILPQNAPYFYNLVCNNTNLTELTNLPSTLSQINCSNNPYLTSVDLNGSQVNSFNCENNPLLETISFKNGFLNITGGDGGYEGYYSICNNPNLSFVCADSGETDNNSFVDAAGEIATWIGIQQLLDNCGYTDVVVNSYCTFEPGGNFNVVQGSNSFDANNNGCNIEDSSFANLKYNISYTFNNAVYGSFISNENGDYIFYVGGGSHTISPDLNSEYFTASPESFSVNFQTDTSPFTQDFCITPNGTYNDLEITILPLEAARPGFDANYKLTYKNKGTTTLSGSVALNFQDAIMDLIAANPTADSQTDSNLSWNYSNLAPFSSGEILFTMNLNTPTDTPPVNGDDVLVFTATINPVSGDETPEDNAFTLNQAVVNSYDPNDKTCLEGEVITPDLVGKDVHYLIRFENTGTANAINVVVKDEIDSNKFDVSSLSIIDSSHDLVTRITSGNVVQFIFENINLPFDDANNDGYIAFKIKTLNTLVAGDTFENDAEIYFDFNFPIDTNIAMTSVENTLGLTDLSLIGLEVYPNPVKDAFTVKGSNSIESVSMYDISGRLVSQVALMGNQTEVSISTDKLSGGTYFVKVKTDASEGVKKIIKE